MSCTPKTHAPVEVCGACAGLAPSTPRAGQNRSGLAAISYRIGAYPQFKASLLAGLSSARYPALAGLRTRNADDFTIGLIDAVACVADVLSFYQERLANESYLRTATERVSLQEMGKLIGYRLRPGLAAQTWLAFALESPRTPPPGLPPEPGAFVTGIPTSLTLAPGLKVQSVPGPDEKAQTFETVEALPARPEWSAMRVLADEDVVPGLGATDTWLAGVDTQLKPGDALLFVGHEFDSDATSDRWDVRVVQTAQADPAAGRTHVTWQQPLGSVSPVLSPAVAPRVYALRQRAAVFGHNAPDWQGMTDAYKAAYLGLESPEQLTQIQRQEWPQYKIYGPGSGPGAQSFAQVAPMQAATALREVLKAEGVVEVRRAMASVSALGASAGSLVEKAAAVPGEVGKAAVEAMALVPGAVGQVAEVVMAPIRWLVESGIGTVESHIEDVARGAASAVGVVNTIAGILNPILGLTLTTQSGVTTGATWQNMPAMPALLSDGTELDQLRKKLLGSFDANGVLLDKGALQNVQGKLDELADSAKSLRSTAAGAVAAALSVAADAAYAAHIEAQLNISPRLPFATAEKVCDEVMRASTEALLVLPDLVVAMALSDPKPGLVLLATMAEADAGFWEANQGAQQLAQRMASNFQNAVANQDQRDPVDMGLTCQPWLDQLGSGATVLQGAVQRLREAAAGGVKRAHQALRKRSDALRDQAVARHFIGQANDAVSLDRVYAGVLQGGYAVLQSPTYTELYGVTGVADTSRAEYGMAGKSTLLTLRGENLKRFETAVRETTVLVQSQALARARTPISRSVSGDVIEVGGAVNGLVKDRRLIVQGRDALSGVPVAHQAMLLEDARVSIDHTTLHFTPPLSSALRRDSVVVFGNVALATHGDTVAQILGAGDASHAFQGFELKRLPLTYRSASNESGADSELTVRVGDVEWHERRSLYHAGPDERSYAVRTDEQGRDWVVFGDGESGARLPSGVNNVRASYRQGLGQAGNVSADTLTQLMTRPMGLKSVSNPAPAEGGADPEAAESARRSMPLGTRTLGRAVSLRDYEDFALAFTGIAKAQARVLNLASGTTIAITVAGPDGHAVPVNGPIWRHLLEALQSCGDPHIRITLLPHQASSFRLGLKVKRDPAYAIEPLLAQVQAELRAHFSFQTRDLAQPVLQSEVIAVAHGVPGVLAIDLDLLYGGSWPAAQTLPSLQTRLLACPLRVDSGVAKTAELLTLNAAAFDRLEEMT